MEKAEENSFVKLLEKRLKLPNAREE